MCQQWLANHKHDRKTLLKNKCPSRDLGAANPLRLHALNCKTQQHSVNKERKWPGTLSYTTRAHRAWCDGTASCHLISVSLSSPIDLGRQKKPVTFTTGPSPLLWTYRNMPPKLPLWKISRENNEPGMQITFKGTYVMKTRAAQTSTQSSCRHACFFSTCNGARSDVSLVAKGPRHFSRNLLLQLFCVCCHEKQLSPRYTPHSALYTLHPTTPHYTPLHPVLHTLHSTHSTRSALYTPHWTLYTPHSALRTLHNRLYSRACHAICALTPLDAALPMRFATNTQHDTPKVLRLPRKMTMAVSKLLHLPRTTAPVTQNGFRHFCRHVRVCHACLAKRQYNLFWRLQKRRSFCSFPPRHGGGRKKPEKRDETCWSLKTNISCEMPSNFNTSQLQNRRFPASFLMNLTICDLKTHVSLPSICTLSPFDRETTRLKCCACHAEWRWRFFEVMRASPKNADHLLKTLQKYCACHTKTTLDILWSRLECHEAPRPPRETRLRDGGNLQKRPLLQNPPEARPYCWLLSRNRGTMENDDDHELPFMDS